MKNTAALSGSQSRKPRLLFFAVVAALVATAILTACPDPNVPMSTLTGTIVINNYFPEVGDYLTAYYNGNGRGTQSWQWLANDVAIPGANGNGYNVSPGDLGKTLKARVSFSDQTGSISSSATTAVIRKTNGNNPVVQTEAFNSIGQLASWLSSQPTNTISKPYKVELNVSSLGGGAFDNGSLGAALLANNNKYVYLDLSGSTFTSISWGAFENCTNLTSVTIPSSVTSIGT
jgi:hypothetical protein